MQHDTSASFPDPTTPKLFDLTGMIQTSNGDLWVNGVNGIA